MLRQATLVMTALPYRDLLLLNLNGIHRNGHGKQQNMGGCHRLLAADMSQLSARLMVMRLAAQSTNVNVLKIVEDHPCLLLQESFTLDQQARQPFSQS